MFKEHGSSALQVIQIQREVCAAGDGLSPISTPKVQVEHTDVELRRGRIKEQ